MAIAIVGGTGNIGNGLAINLVKSGYKVIIGSRSNEKAISSAKKIKKITGKNSIDGMKNIDAVKKGDLVILSIPNIGRRIVLSELKPFLIGKTIFDVTVPIAFNPIRHVPPKEGSNAMETKIICGNSVNVVAGMHTVSANLLYTLEQNTYNFDMLIAGDDNLSKKRILDIFSNLGIRAFDAGMLDQAETLEKLAVMLISINKRYKKSNIGIKLYGI